MGALGIYDVGEWMEWGIHGYLWGVYDGEVALDMMIIAGLLGEARGGNSLSDAGCGGWASMATGDGGGMGI